MSAEFCYNCREVVDHDPEACAEAEWERECPNCNGEGTVYHTLTREEEHFIHPFDAVCRQCGGKGYIRV